MTLTMAAVSHEACQLLQIFMTGKQCIPVLAEVQVPYACELILFSVILLVQHVHNFTSCYLV